MPTYEYKREDGSTFEIIQKMSESPLAECPTTGQKVRRVVSGGGGVVYKGEGWYVTDYKNGGKKSDSSPSSEKTEKATGTNTDKTAPKSEKAAPTND
jgi:putative FmdB family regulatory protein